MNIETITTDAPIEITQGVDAINRRLIELYGKDIAVSMPNYRIVWSSNQYEWRNNEPEGFDIFDETGTIFLRTEHGPKECDKYPNHPDMWVLEVLIPKTALDMSILVDPVKWSYEPLWVFGSGNSNPQPIWRGVQFLVNAHKFKQEVIKRTDKDLLIEDMKKLAKEKEECKQYLRSENPAIHAQIRAGEAAIISNTDYLVKE